MFKESAGRVFDWQRHSEIYQMQANLASSFRIIYTQRIKNVTTAQLL